MTAPAGSQSHLANNQGPFQRILAKVAVPILAKNIQSSDLSRSQEMKSSLAALARYCHGYLGASFLDSVGNRDAVEKLRALMHSSSS